MARFMNQIGSREYQEILDCLATLPPDMPLAEVEYRKHLLFDAAVQSRAAKLKEKSKAMRARDYLPYPPPGITTFGSESCLPLEGFEALPSPVAQFAFPALRIALKGDGIYPIILACSKLLAVEPALMCIYYRKAGHLGGKREQKSYFRCVMRPELRKLFALTRGPRFLPQSLYISTVIDPEAASRLTSQWRLYFEAMLDLDTFALSLRTTGDR